MRVIQVVSSIAAESSGPSYSVPRLCGGLKAVGVDVELHVPEPVPAVDYSFKVFRYPRKTLFHLRGAEWSPSLKQALCRECANTDVIHTNGLWMIPNVYAAKASKGTKCKLVTAPRGSLATWALGFRKMKKRVIGRLIGQYAAMRATDMWHATSEKEYGEIRAAGFRQPVAIVPIGIDLPMMSVANKEKAGCRKRGMSRLVFFGRLHKVKAVDNLILAWELVADRFKNWELIIAGPDGGIRDELESLVATRKIPRVSFLGELNGVAKYEYLAAADLCVLPSYTENFGVTVAESLACGTPVVASQGTPWRGLAENGAGWWIPIGVHPLVEQLRQSLAYSTDELMKMGTRGREWMARDFSWIGIGAKMRTSYDWLLGRCERPDWVKVAGNE